MNNNNKNKSTFLKENGLLVGLYSVVGVLVVTAGVLTVKSIEPTSLDSVDGEPVNTSITQSYTDEQIGDSLFTNSPNYEQPKTTPSTEKPSKIITSEDKVSDAGDLETSSTNFTDSFDLEDELSIQTSSPVSEGVTAEVLTDEPAQDVATVAMFTAFNTGDKMQWPVVGEVVLPYSNLLAIYDPTLEQFRTNETVSIKSAIGQDVKASAEGQVIDVSSNEVNGNYVTIQHGNGWTTTYGQLESSIPVKVGDVVSVGSVVGKTAKPTKYSVALGEHVDFKVALNDETVNPETVLAKN